MTYYPVVVQVVAGPGKTVYAYFSDGQIKQYDLSPSIARGGVFAPLADADFFTQRLTVLNDTVAWDVSGRYDAKTCIDIDPFEVYAAESVSDPLAG